MLSIGRAALDKALESARTLFNDPAARPDAKKVLVVITDKASGLHSATIKSAAKPLKQSKIRIIAFSVGGEGSTRELENLTPHLDDVRQVKSIAFERPEKLGQEIMKLVLTGELIGQHRLTAFESLVTLVIAIRSTLVIADILGTII